MLSVLRNIDSKEFSNTYQEIKDAFSLDVVLKKKPLQITSVLGFKIVLPEIVNEKNPFVFLQKDNEQFIIKMGDSTTGNAKRIVMTLKQFDKVVLKIHEKLAQMRKRWFELDKALEAQDSPYHKQLRECQEEINHIIAQMNIYEPEFDC